ncbi:uncharacterized protein LOC111868140 [Cryptotermes secundus]|uniref:uncharacterized protein LOC111868140 n=1 Tax=Cryptotermes secundus TaxID=105785 RepID=UPI000CD7C608|nr:uncharacterized protein LOC111868140 [Cryptotermes secundus]
MGNSSTIVEDLKESGRYIGCRRRPRYFYHINMAAPQETIRKGPCRPGTRTPGASSTPGACSTPGAGPPGRSSPEGRPRKKTMAILAAYKEERKPDGYSCI